MHGTVPRASNVRTHSNVGCSATSLPPSRVPGLFEAALASHRSFDVTPCEGSRSKEEQTRGSEAAGLITPPDSQLSGLQQQINTTLLRTALLASS